MGWLTRNAPEEEVDDIALLREGVPLRLWRGDVVSGWSDGAQPGRTDRDEEE